MVGAIMKSILYMIYVYLYLHLYSYLCSLYLWNLFIIQNINTAGLQFQGGRKPECKMALISSYTPLVLESVVEPPECMSAQSCLTPCDPMDCSPPGSSVYGVFQARILEWVAISSSRGSLWPRDQSHVSCVSCSWQVDSLLLCQVMFNDINSEPSRRNWRQWMRLAFQPCLKNSLPLWL